MEVKLTSTKPTAFTLEISADQALIDRVKKKVLIKLGASQVKLSGFRAGKAPLNLIEKNVNQDVLHSDFLEEAVNELYVNAVKQEGIRPVSQPKITLKKFVPFTQLEFEAEIEAVGKVKLANYKQIKLAKQTAKVSVEDVKEVINRLKLQFAEKLESKDKAVKGDEVIIDFKGSDSKGQPVNGADGTDYPLVLGSNTFIPGFEPELIGLKAGDDKKFEVTFPKNYGVKALQGKKVSFEVKVKKVNKIVEPKVDDSFAAKVGPFKSLQALKDDIKKQLTIERQTQVDRNYENELVKKISDKSTVEVPESLINDQVLRAEQSEKQNLAYQGVTWEEHLKSEGVTEEEHRKRNRPEAEQNVKAGLVLSEIADVEGLEVTPEELEIRIQVLKGQYKDAQMQAELDKPENKREIESRLLTEKTLEKLVQYAK